MKRLTDGQITDNIYFTIQDITKGTLLWGHELYITGDYESLNSPSVFIKVSSNDNDIEKLGDILGTSKLNNADNPIEIMNEVLNGKLIPALEKLNMIDSLLTIVNKTNTKGYCYYKVNNMCNCL